MDILSVKYISILTIAAILIIITLVTLPHVGDERKRMIKTKAQSYTFTIIIFLMVVDAGKELYCIFWGCEPYEATSSFAMLGSAAFIYVSSLLFLRRKYGD